MSINTQKKQFQKDNNKDNERGVFILELQVGKDYIMKEDEVGSNTGTVFVRKGAKVTVLTIGEKRVLVKDLSDDAFSDGLWSVDKSKLVAPEDAEEGVEEEEATPALEKDAIYVMKRAEVSGDGRITYIKKGARVRIADFGRISVLVEDLSEDKVDDGVWMTSVDALMPLEDALIVGEMYYMGEAETNSYGDVTFLEKGALVRLEVWGRTRCVVQDLSEAKHGDGCWYTDPVKLMPIDKPEGSREEAEASNKNKVCMESKDYTAELEAADANGRSKEYEVGHKNDAPYAPVVPLEDMVVIKNKHYVSDHQPIETMQSNMTHDEMVGFLKGNIIKYACRCGKKDEPLKEAEKIKQYAEWLCIVLSGGTIDPRS